MELSQIHFTWKQKPRSQMISTLINTFSTGFSQQAERSRLGKVANNSGV
jgi:hypothetical protein